MANTDRGLALRGERQQTQQEEDDDLHQVGQAVKERYQGLLASDVGVAQDDADDVGAQVAVAADQVGYGIGKYGYGQDEQGVESGCGRAEMLHQPYGSHGNHCTYSRSVGYLGKYHVGYPASGCGALDYGHHDDGQHVGAGVVASALNLQQGCGVVFETQLAGTQYGEDRGRVGRAEHRSDQETEGRRHFQYVVAEQSGKTRRQGHSEGGEDAGLDHYRPCLFPPGTETAVEHDEDQCHGADGLSDIEIVKGDLDHPVRAEGHAQQNERQQHRDSDLVGDVVEYHAQDDDYCGYQQEESYGHRKKYCGSTLSIEPQIY